MTNPKLEEAFDVIRTLLAAEYARGRHDEMERVRQLLAGGVEPEQPASIEPHQQQEANTRQSAKRAPRGSVRELVQRVLNNRTAGVTVSEIYQLRQGPSEEMIERASIRTELKRGELEGRYEERHGLWFSGIMG